MVFGNKVIDHERVFGVQESPLKVAAIYEVTPEGIAKFWFVSERVCEAMKLHPQSDA